MSISSAISSALSGLNASSRQVQAISTNLANSLTPGYGVRQLELESLSSGLSGGVRIAASTRNVDEALISDRRRADSALASSTTSATFFAELERTLGTPEDPKSLTARLAEFEASLISASARPEEETRLQSAVLRADEIVQALNNASDRVQALRSDAETRIQQDVTNANEYLRQLETLNGQIVDAKNRGVPAAALQDQRSVVLDQLTEIVPLRVFQRDNGSISIYTPTGAGLLDGRAAELSFSPANVIAPHMTQANGLLAQLEINGNPVATADDRSPIAGGRLAANFGVRDGLAVDAQAQLDAIARNLIERFQDTAVDPTITPGDPGLFSDGGAAFDAVDEVGIAGRISLSDEVRPEAGGDYRRLRDGLYAAGPGSPGDATLLQNLTQALSEVDSLASGNLGGTSRGAAGHVASMMGYFGEQRLSLDQSVAFSRSNQAGLVENELSFGVNTDEELQRLLLVEQAYAANARLIQTAGEMLDELLRI